MTSRPFVFFLLVVPLLALPLSGCLGGDPALRPFDGSGAEVTIRSVYDKGLRTQGANESLHAAVDVPQGMPAERQVFQIILRPIEGIDYLGWEGDEHCAPGFVNKASGEQRKTDCSASDDKDVIVVPPPNATRSATRYNYRFDDAGERVLVFPQPVDVAVRLMAIYSDPLLAARADPSGCHEFESFAVGAHSTATGGVETLGAWLRVNGDGVIEAPFYGICNVD